MSKRTPAFIEDSDEELREDEESSPKKTKKTVSKKSKKPAASPPENREEQEDDLLPLSSKRFVSVSVFHGKIMINIREYYNDKETGELKPGKKGISLSLDQWENLKKFIPTLDGRVKNMS